MPSYNYKLISPDKEIKEGTIVAFSKFHAKRKLNGNGSAIVFLVRGERSPLIFQGKFSAAERILFFRNLATMLQVDMPLASAMAVLEEQASGKKLKAVMHSILSDIQGGKRLSAAMKKFPAHFPEVITETVAVGELSGKLDATLGRISADLERNYDLAKRVKAAMIYPIIILTAMLLVVSGLIIFVLPRIVKLFEDLHAAIPLPTRILLGFGQFLTAYYLWILGAMAAVYVTLRFSRKNKNVRYFIHSLFLRIPFFGKMIREYNLANFFRSLGSLYGTGISLVQAVEISKNTLSSEVYRRALGGAKEILVRGLPLSDALKPHRNLFTLQTERIIGVGEKSGKLEEVFERVTDYYERALVHKLTILPSVIEPVLILLLGGGVALIALSVFIPIYSALNAF